MILAKATSEAFKTIVENEARLYKEIAQKFNFNSTQLLQYIYMDELSESLMNYNYYLNPTNAVIDYMNS